MVALRVEDDGPGIADSLLTAAVEPGRRLDERGDGHGFGLSITRELAELHGGGLLLANSGEAGLVATLRLPAAL
jgi:signal transduction histidine kinase